MDRSGPGFAYHIPVCNTRVGEPDQYGWPHKDPYERKCNNGLNVPIYSCDGQYSYSLPLELMSKDYTKVHPDIAHGVGAHFLNRDRLTYYSQVLPKMVEERSEYDRNVARLRAAAETDLRAGRLEGLYNHN